MVVGHGGQLLLQQLGLLYEPLEANTQGGDTDPVLRVSGAGAGQFLDAPGRRAIDRDRFRVLHVCNQGLEKKY